MTAPSLTPAAAARLADAVYGIERNADVAMGVAQRGVEGLDADWSLSEAAVATGRSGAVFRPASGFGMVLDGVAGPMQGHKAVAIRGTSSGWDWLSNFNASLDLGPGGLVVQAGFHRVYRSMIGQIVERVGDHRGPIHVVGHSLGGAVAHLTAAELNARGFPDVRLYTFGAPRALHEGSTRRLTARLGADRMFRVLNLADPVPMVPLWPFAHAPAPGEGVNVGGSTARISIDAHFMSSYRPLLEGGGVSWASLRAASGGMRNMRSVSYWLEQAEQHVRIPGSALGLRVLGRAVQAVLDSAGLALGALALGTATMLDVLSSLLMSAARASVELAGGVARLMGLALRWLGRAAVTGARLTATFIGYVLGLMFRPLAAAARNALERQGG